MALLRNTKPNSGTEKQTARSFAGAFRSPLRFPSAGRKLRARSKTVASRQVVGARFYQGHPDGVTIRWDSETRARTGRLYRCVSRSVPAQTKFPVQGSMAVGW